MPLTVPLLLDRLRAADSGRPRLTYYGADGERVELSARVLANWVAKTANLLLEELEAGSGTRVHLDLPPHWRTAVWTLAAWTVGAEPLSPSTSSGSGAPDPDDVDPADPAGTAHMADTDPAGADDVWVTTPDRARQAPPEPQLVVVALPALAWSAAGPAPLPAGALDYNASVAGFGDDFPPTRSTALDALLDAVPADRRWADATPLLEEAADYSPAASLLAPLAAGGALVLRGPGAPDAAHIAEQEHAARR